MADKPKRKKPKHTNLALPSDKDARKYQRAGADRIGRKLPDASPGSFFDASVSTPRTPTGGAIWQERPAGADAPEAPAPQEEAGVYTGAPNGPAYEAAPPPESGGAADALPDNVIVLPRQKPRVSKAKRRRRRRRLLFLGFVAFVCAMMMFYYSGLYLNAALGFSDLYDTVRIAFAPGPGYPANFTMAGFIGAETLGAGGFAALGAKDMAVYSSTGKELRRIQHGYANPGFSTADTRVCVYGRGGHEYIVDSRSDNIVRRQTEQEILFCEMSPGGWLAVVTSSRYRSTLAVYNPVYDTEPQLQWPIIDEKPVCGAFHSDNRTIALGCLSARGGALGTTVYVLRADSEDIVTSIAADGACVVQLAFVGTNRLLAIYDTYAAVYDMKGAEQARYDYNGATLRAADTYDGKVALVFGASERETIELVVLDGDLATQFRVTTESDSAPRPMLTRYAVYLKTGFDVLTYTPEGALYSTAAYALKPLALVRVPEPVLLTVSSAEPLKARPKVDESGAPVAAPAPSAQAAPESGGEEGAGASS